MRCAYSYVSCLCALFQLSALSGIDAENIEYAKVSDVTFSQPRPSGYVQGTCSCVYCTCTDVRIASLFAAPSVAAARARARVCKVSVVATGQRHVSVQDISIRS